MARHPGNNRQGPVTIHAMIDPDPGPSFEDQENALPKRDKIIQICQSDEMFTWIHALVTMLVINEKAVIGGLKVSEQLKVWQDRIRILKKPPWIFAPLNLVKTDMNTTWAEAMTACPVMGTDGLLTLAKAPLTAYCRRLRDFSASSVLCSKSYGIRLRCTKLWRPTTILKLWPPPSRPSTIKHAGRAGLSIVSSSTCRKTESKSVRCASITESGIRQQS